MSYESISILAVFTIDHSGYRTLNGASQRTPNKVAQSRKHKN